MSFEFSLIIDSIPKMLAGIGITLELLLLSMVIGTILAIFILLMRISNRWYLCWPAMSFIYIFRGTPILIQIFIIYYGFPQFEFIRESIFWPMLREPYGCAVLALTINNAAYVSEIFRGGVNGVDRGYLEAGAALGLSIRQRFIYITAPIAIRLSIPAYSNDVIGLMKATALASTITLLDMMGIARTIVAEYYAPYEIFISLAIIYLIMTWIIQNAFGLLEKRMSRHIRQ
ncbi:MAG: ABC transporter permease [Rhodospirillales bacterium]|jgi:octopine/nopaline transport system permease protein|nr:ABC transporter permease [Rhodospirillales bacterium]